MNSPRETKRMIERLESLPPIPKIAQKILALKISTDEGERSLFNLIQKDPTLMSKIIGLANSPLFATGRKILTLHDAQVLLGSKRVKMIALGFAMMSSISKHSKGLLNLDGLWKHSLLIAFVMDTLAKCMPKDRRPAEDEIYLAGLLHDIGFLVLNHIDPMLFDQFCTRLAEQPGRTVEEIEAEMLDMNHCELAAELGRHWGLPDTIIAVLRFHHAPNEHPDAAQQPLVGLAYLAAKLLPTFNINESAPKDIAAEDWASLGIDPLLADDIKAKIQEHIDQAGEINA